MGTDWDDLLVTFLHDPPDKALDIPGHEARAAMYVEAALGRRIGLEELRAGTRSEDQQAAIAERLPMPKAGRRGERAAGLEAGGTLHVSHPLSGEGRSLDPPQLDPEEVARRIRSITSGIEDPRRRFLALWRLLPDNLAAWGEAFAHLPADTRVPDHTIWNHLDTSAGFHAALSGGHGAAFLSFSIGPVQQFIAAARSVRDLWSGSAILSWLTFRALLPVVEELGPTAVIFPSLRGTPLLDLWLQRSCQLSERLELPPQALRTPCYPNRFLAIVPWGEAGAEAKKLARRCERAALEAWGGLAERVRRLLSESLSEAYPRWDDLWEAQIASFLEIRTAALPLREAGEDRIARLHGCSRFQEAYPEAASVRALAAAIPEAERPPYAQDSAGRWQAQVELAGRLLEARRAIRHIPRYTPGVPAPPKCTLMGTYEQMGPAELECSAAFWRHAATALSVDGIRLRRAERLSAICLVKRFATPAALAEEFGLDPQTLRFPDTATVAAAHWLREAGLDPDEVRQRCGGRWNGQWLHWPAPDFDREDEAPQEAWRMIQEAKARSRARIPPAYFAVLAMDADDMGGWLRGERAPSVAEALHPKLREYFERLLDGSALRARRPLGPGLHAAISAALTNFAVHIAPRIVRRHEGILIYAGGDDLLALSPARSALACARELRRAFSGDPDVNGGAPRGYYRLEHRDLLVMGPRASLSAGIAVVHCRDDLRSSIELARGGLHRAKESGRDAMGFVLSPRSGERSSALLTWPAVEAMERWVSAFEAKASERWVHSLRSELPGLLALPVEGVKAEIRRLIDRSEPPTRELLGAVAEEFERYFLKPRPRDPDAPLQPSALMEEALHDFVASCLSAAFLARGGDSA